MPRVRETLPTEHSGCLVSGRRLHVDGTADTTALSVTPTGNERTVSGVLYSASAVTIQPDSDGYFSATLPPGEYLVQMSTRAWTMTVPDSARAQFSQIVEVT